MTYSKMFNNKLAIVAAVAGTFALSGGAMAGSSAQGLETWADAASHSVDKVMRYPRTTVRGNGNGAARFRVTIDRDGDVIASNQLRRIGSSILNSAAKQVLKRADFPALPGAYDGDTLTFVLQLNYGTSDQAAFPREGKVSSRQIASSGSRTLAGLTIIDTNAD